MSPKPNINYRSREWGGIMEWIDERIAALDIENRNPLLDEKETLMIRVEIDLLQRQREWGDPDIQMADVPTYAVPQRNKF